MREIKFKVLNKNWNVIGYVYKIDFDKKMIYYTTKNSLLQSVHFVNAEIMQYTGLKDKNGVDVYEGDIVEVKVNLEATKTFTEGEVIYNNGGCFLVKDIIFGQLYRLYDCYEIEIIGNIFENPELLDKEG